MGTWLIFTGFLFLINPDYYTLDIFPDLIGYLLIARGLKRLSFLEDRLQSAVRYAHFLVLTGAIEIAMNLAVFSTRLESDRLLIMFSFFVAELWLGLLLLNHAAGGFQYLAVRHSDGLSLKGYEVTKTFLTVFFIAKPTLSFLPASLSIVFPEVDSDPNKLQGLATYIQRYRSIQNILFIFGSVLTLAIGIYAARILFAYISRCRSDRPFAEKLEGMYREKVTDNENVMAKLSIRSGFRFFLIAYVFLAELYLDHISVFPTPLFFLFLFLGLRKMEKVVSVPRFGKLFCVFGGAVSCFAYVFRLAVLYSNRLATHRFPLAFYRHLLNVPAGLLELAAVMTGVVLMLKVVGKCAEKYTDYRYLPYFIALIVVSCVMGAISFLLYRNPATYVYLPLIEWGVAAVGIYLHKKSMDDIREEAENHLT